MTLPATGLLLAVGAALAWSGLDATRKALTRHLAPVPLVVLLTLGQAPTFAVWGAVEGAWIGGPGYLAPGLACLATNVLANVGFVRAVQLSPLSLTVPFLSFTPVFTAGVAIPLLGELPTAVQLAGIAAVVGGALLMHAGGGLLGVWRAFLRERGSVIMTGVALLWSLTAVLDKAALEHASVPAHALVQTGGVAVLLLLWLRARGRVAELAGLRHGVRPFLAAVVFATVAVGLQLLAIQAVLVALVETIKRAVGMTMSVVVGRLAFGEPVDAPKVLAIVLMAAGTAAVTLG